MLGLFCNETYNVMTKYNDGDDNRADNGNKYGNGDDNVTSISGSNGPIFDMVETPWYYVGILVDGGDGTYSRGALYIYPSKYVP